MIQFSSLFMNYGLGFGRFRQSLLSGFRTFLPVAESGDTFTRSGS